LLLACLSLSALLALAAKSDVPSAHAQQQRLAPVINQNSQNAIPDQYMVIFEPGTSLSAVRAAQNTVRNLGGKVEFTYKSALIGFSARIPPEALQAVRAIPRIAYIEADQMGSIATDQVNPPTGLDRTSERLLPLNNHYTYSEMGAGVHVYVIDTGIRATHTDFGGRVSGGVDEVLDGNGTNDCHSHGTHVAGTVGGTTYGVAKQVSLHPVRVLNCIGNGPSSGVIAGIDWVTANAVHPAVANVSLQFPGGVTAMDTAVANSVASGVTYAVAAGNFNTDACTVSPARAPSAITVGSVDPTNDTRASDSDFGPCLDLFATGVNILSVGIANDTATATKSGTSMASPHVAGVAARYLQNHTAATPAQVLTAIHNAANVTGTMSWAGVVNPGAGSPNELLHWGSLNDGFNDGDPHILTVDGTHYDFQGAGEFVSLRDGGTEIQTRQTPVSTASIVGPNEHTGLTSCVSLNTALAARVNNRRVTYEPNLSGVPDPSGLQLRIDGALTTLGPSGVDLGNGGRVMRTSEPGGIQIDFPDGTSLFAVPNWWADQGKWYINLHVAHTPASAGIMGALAPGSWLPALPDGSSLGPRPAALADRYAALYQQFGEAWRVTGATSLFDYAPGTSTDTFTLRSWPSQQTPCTVPASPTAQPATRAVAENACRLVKGNDRRADCIFDVMVTGFTGFANTYAAEEKVVEEHNKSRNNTSTNPNPHPNPNPPLKDRWALFLDFGANFPHGTLSPFFDPGFSFNAGLEYMVNPYFSAEGIFGYHRFSGAGGGHANLYQLSGNAKAYLNGPSNSVRPFVNGGVGAYVFDSGTTRVGGNVGAGLLYEATPHFELQGSYNFHMVNTAGTSLKYSTLQGGVRFRF
jgi:hypothetical protein